MRKMLIFSCSQKIENLQWKRPAKCWLKFAKCRKNYRGRQAEKTAERNENRKYRQKDCKECAECHRSNAKCQLYREEMKVADDYRLEN